jgi:hypothetical protein
VHPRRATIVIAAVGLLVMVALMLEGVEAETLTGAGVIPDYQREYESLTITLLITLCLRSRPRPESVKQSYLMQDCIPPYGLVQFVNRHFHLEAIYSPLFPKAHLWDRADGFH